jgi:hypothetical protein
MCHFVGTSRYFSTTRPTFSDGHGAVADEDRKWEDGYRLRWQQDKIVRSTHGVNCTGSCSWEVYVKGGIESRRGLGGFLLPILFLHAARPAARPHDLLQVPVRDRVGVADSHLPVGSAA